MEPGADIEDVEAPVDVDLNFVLVMFLCRLFAGLRAFQAAVRPWAQTQVKRKFRYSFPVRDTFLMYLFRTTAINRLEQG